MRNKYYYSDGTTSNRYENDKTLHNKSGPAVEFESGTKHWYINGELYRADGPAIEYADGRRSWCIDWKLCSEEEFNQIISEAKSLDRILQLTDERW